jgi:RHS repeat-associated protein
MVVAGLLNEPGTVTINGVPAAVDASNNFRGTVPTSTGTNSFTIVAKDASGNTTTKTYEVDVAGTGKTFTHDANGNLTSDGTRTLEWDARNRLVAATEASLRTEFLFDGQHRRVRIVEKLNGVTQSNKPIVWCQGQVCEERAADGTSVSLRKYEYGDVNSGASQFAVSDHLRSRIEYTDVTGALTARYSYDPWGRRSLVSGTNVTDIGFGGLPLTANLSWALYRTYDPDYGRWNSEDPAGLVDGPNRFGYVQNRPTTMIDPSGLSAQCATAAAAFFYKCVGLTLVILAPVETALVLSCMGTGPAFSACLAGTHHLVLWPFFAYEWATWTSCTALAYKTYRECERC